MKTLLLIAVAGFMVASLSSCNKDYECCYLDSNGNKLSSDPSFGCSIIKMTKKEADNLEERMINSAQENVGGTASCTKS